MISEELEQEMVSYYDARAGEYDEFYAGRGPAIRQHAGQYVRDVAETSAIVAGFGTGHVIDIACGTGFWAAHYARNCDEITFVDPSGAMLAECERRIGPMGLADGSHFVRGDFFGTELGEATYDCAFVGFLLSHITPEREGAFFGRLRGD